MRQVVRQRNNLGRALRCLLQIARSEYIPRSVFDAQPEHPKQVFASTVCMTAIAKDTPTSLEDITERYRLTHQEQRQLREAAQDLTMWGEGALSQWWVDAEAAIATNGDLRARKKQLLQSLQAHLSSLRIHPKSFPAEGLPPRPKQKLRRVAKQSDKTIIGMCPVASEETVCCNLRTIDAVENCGMGCSYCAVQTFYGDEVVFDANLKEKLQAIELDGDRFYHIGTGQSSDALMWGNQRGMLDDLCGFARAHDNVLLEFKSKSKNITYFLNHPTPHNVVLSWSLNTPTIIRNEEHFSADLAQRLSAARQVVDRGIKVAFHFHPIVHYDHWREDYAELAGQVTDQFDPPEVLFVSFGSVTFIKPVIKALRQRAAATKMLQMEMVPGAKGKLSYPDELKAEMFSHMYASFRPWHDEVFFYLCMEQAALWYETFGFSYATNDEFEAEFGRRVREKWVRRG